MRRAIVAAALAGALALPLQGRAPAVADETVPEPVTILRVEPNDPEGAAAAYAKLNAVPSTDTAWAPTSTAPGAGRGCPPVRCHDYDVPVPEGVKVQSNRVRVLLPRDYDTSWRRYPVVYLFSGSLSPYYRWSEATELLEVTRDVPAIFVMSSGGTHGEAGMFTDWFDGSWQWETFHTDTLIKWVDRKFRTRPDARAALGASMGGLGAFMLPARHPGLFKAAVGISGTADTQTLVANTLPPELSEGLGLAPPDLSRVWGNPILQRANWQAHNPTALAAKLKGVHLFIAVGTGATDTNSATGNRLHSPYTEMLLWQSHRNFLRALNAAGVGYDIRLRQGGQHYWPYFDDPLRWAMPKLMKALGTPTAAGGVRPSITARPARRKVSAQRPFRVAVTVRGVRLGAPVLIRHRGRPVAKVVTGASSTVSLRVKRRLSAGRRTFDVVYAEPGTSRRLSTTFKVRFVKRH